MQFGFKKDGDVYGAYIDGELFATFEKELKDGNTMSDYIAQYNENKGYLQFGATLENDKDDVELSYTLTHMSGALDAFAEPETPPDDGGDTETPPVQQGSGKLLISIGIMSFYTGSAAQRALPRWSAI